MIDKKNPEWIGRGKTIKELISELQSFENQNLLVELSTDDGVTTKSINLVVKSGGACVLISCSS
jgi:hypothetical protein